MTPQYWPPGALQAVVAHAPESSIAPQTSGVPEPPHVSPAGHPPQSTDPPQASPTTPQNLPPGWSQAVGVQALESGGAPHT
jgi:hypothetical protein